MTSLFEERQDAKDLGNNLGLVRLVVANDLPVFQLRGETLWRKKADPFDSAYDFIIRSKLYFMPMVYLSTQIGNKEVRPIVLDHFDTPYRKFLLMVEVGSMRQAPYESNREYSNRFQKMRREAGTEDGTQLAVTYFASLKPSVKNIVQVAISSHLGAKLPVSINQIQWVKKL
ncbi:hypothetical protein G6F23_013129 [Rhizopus arrhizus]|nr:hypothetical protein G6F23_013129 [Rhizopus arrhizus]